MLFCRCYIELSGHVSDIGLIFESRCIDKFGVDMDISKDLWWAFRKCLYGDRSRSLGPVIKAFA